MHINFYGPLLTLFCCGGVYMSGKIGSKYLHDVNKSAAYGLAVLFFFLAGVFSLFTWTK